MNKTKKEKRKYWKLNYQRNKEKIKARSRRYYRLHYNSKPRKKPMTRKQFLARNRRYYRNAKVKGMTMMRCNPSLIKDLKRLRLHKNECLMDVVRRLLGKKRR